MLAESLADGLRNAAHHLISHGMFDARRWKGPIIGQKNRAPAVGDLPAPILDADAHVAKRHLVHHGRAELERLTRALDGKERFNFKNTNVRIHLVPFAIWFDKGKSHSLFYPVSDSAANSDNRKL